MPTKRSTCYIACPAFALHGPLDRDRIIADITSFTDKVGLEVVRSPLLDRHLGHGAWLPAEERRADILRAIEHDLVWPVRGGHGSIHLAATLLAAKTSKRPVLIGYSDVTILHACWKVRGWGESFYGAIPTHIRGCRGGETLMALLSGEGYVRSADVDAGVRVLRPGTVTGPCFTACASVLAHLCGTPFQPKLRGCVLAIEDTNEKPYMIDGVLNQLSNSGALDGIVGLIGGGFPHEEKPDYSGPTIEEILIEWAERLRVPTIAWLPFGHINDGLTLPCGRAVTIDAHKSGQWSLTVAQRDDDGRGEEAVSGLADIVDRAVDLRRDLHRHPELMYDEKRTAEVVRRELDRLAIPWRACAGTGTVATLAPSAAGKHIALRADLDALPLDERTGLPWASVNAGVMHACGHDGHTASLLAAAAYLKSRESSLPGPVTLVFQPAEEGGHGASKMVADGALKGVAEIYGYHNWPPIPFGRAAAIPGPIMSANGEWTATITGRGGHASAPHQCIDPILAGAHFVTTVQQIVSRMVAPQESAVVTVTCFHGGTADNIIPDAVELVGTVRAATTERRDELVRKVEAVLAAASAPSGATHRFDYRPCYPATVNEPACAARAAAALDRVLGAGHRWSEGLPLMAAEDFGFYLRSTPGCFILLGAGRRDAPVEGCHSPRFDFNDELIPVVVRLWADIAGVPVK